jgi:hypothetical protein
LALGLLTTFSCIRSDWWLRPGAPLELPMFQMYSMKTPMNLTIRHSLYSMGLCSYGIPGGVWCIYGAGAAKVAAESGRSDWAGGIYMG